MRSGVFEHGLEIRAQRAKPEAFLFDFRAVNLRRAYSDGMAAIAQIDGDGDVRVQIAQGPKSGEANRANCQSNGLRGADQPEDDPPDASLSPEESSVNMRRMLSAGNWSSTVPVLLCTTRTTKRWLSGSRTTENSRSATSRLFSF